MTSTAVPESLPEVPDLLIFSGSATFSQPQPKQDQAGAEKGDIRAHIEERGADGISGGDLGAR